MRRVVKRLLREESKAPAARSLDTRMFAIPSTHALRCGLFLSFFTVTAFGQCTFTINPGANAYVDANGAVDLAGDSLVIQVTASAQTCSWSADATDGFASVNGANTGTGNGSVTYTIPANPSLTLARTTTLDIAGNAITLKQNATVTTFEDVLPNDPRERFYFDGINFLAQKKIAAGTSSSPPLYSPTQNVTRGQMAVFIVSTIYNGSGGFTYSDVPYFTDVLPSDPFFKFIQKMRDLGIAAGETATTYGPNDPVTRAQMAVFITLARLGPQTAFTYGATQQFGDVPPSNPFFKFVQKLAEMGITAGCTTATPTTLANYCPNDAVTRDQMAIFLIVGGFNLLEPTAPAVTSVSPNSGVAGTSVPVTVTGVNTHFDATTTILATAGVTSSTPTNVTSTSFQTTLTIPAGASLGQISLTTETPDANAAAGEEATLPNGFAIGSGAPVPAITSFTPASGPIGTAVTVTGSGLQYQGIPVTALLALQGGGTTAAPVTSFTADGTGLTLMIPSTAATGKITLMSSSGSVAAATPFTVVPSSTYTISTTPSTANLIAGQSTTYTITSSTSNGFSSLAALSLSGLPAGLTASFNPAQISIGQQAILTITAPANQPTNTATLAINANATVDGIAVPAAATATLNVLPITTSFLGRTVVDDGTNTSLVGVTVSMMGLDGSGNKTGCAGSTTSDGSGNFALTNLPASCIGPQLISFSPDHVTSPAGTYAGVDLVFTLVSSQVVISPILVHLPRTNNLETFMVTQNATTDQSYTFKTIPGLAVTVYAGTVITAPDGSQPNPYPLAAVEIPVDRLPDVMPATTATVTPFIVSFPPANTTTSAPVAVWFPNTLNTPPGTDVPLMTLNPTLGRMVPYGTGTVSNDGTTIVPDIDPSTGALSHRYGIVHFDWHGAGVNPPPDINPQCSCPKPAAGRPIDLSSGVDVLTSTDMVLSGNRGSVSIERTYRTLSTQLRAFGIGGSFNYDYRLKTSTPQYAAVINVEFPDGNLLPFTRQPDGTLINTTTPILLGAVMTTAANGTAKLRFKNGSFFTFAPNYESLMTSVGDANGNITTIVHGGSDPRIITEIDDPVGRKFTFTWNGYPSITSITDPLGRVVRYTYNDATETLATFTNVLGGVTAYTYDSQNRLLTVTDPRGVVTEANTYDANGRVATQMNSAGGILTFVSPPSGSTPALDYVLINPLVPTSPVEQASYRDPLGNTTVYRFNAQGYVTGATDATGQTRTITRAPGTNLILSMTGPGTCPVCGDSRAGDVSFTYDANGNVLTKTDALGNTIVFTYDPVFNNLTSATDALGNVTKLFYDSKGNLIKLTDPNGNITTVARDSNGLINSILDAAGNTTNLTYDGLIGDLTAATNPLNQKTQFSYDAASRLLGLMDPLAQTSTLSYNSGDEPNTLVDGAGSTTRFAYDGAGFLVSFTDANRNQTQFGYDSAGRVSSKTDPLRRTTNYQYDLNDNLIGFTNRRGQKATFSYDALNRLVSETYVDATVQRLYDAAGRLIRVVDSQSGTFEMTYDAVGRLIKTVGPNGTIFYTRDADGEVSSRQVEGQTAVKYTYDPNGNLTGATMGAVSVARIYDGRNLLVSNTRSNGVAGSYSYDPVGRIVTISEQFGAATIFSRAFAYGPTGDLTGDLVDKGLALATPSASGAFDAANELTSFGATTYTSDADGNRLTEASPAGTISYEWDARGRLQAIAAPGGVTTTFLYDFGGNMIEKRVVSSGVDDVQQYILDDVSNIVSVQQGASIISILDGRTPNDIVAIGQAGAPVFPLVDQTFSQSAFTDDSGNVVGREFYEPFGASTTSGTVGLFGYTGQLQINASVYYYRARFYDSVTGRFLSEDPLGIAGGMNMYAYVGGNPISFVDPLGLLDYPTLVRNYPLPSVYPTSPVPGQTTIWNLIGGKVGQNGNSGAFQNSCAIRLSYALNQSGSKIPFIKGITVSGSNGDWYFFRVADLQNYLDSLLGMPQQFTPQNWQSGIGDQTGILEFQNHWGDATGHFDLYNGSTIIDGHDYSTEPSARSVRFYPVK
jgi:RHS repeat-associated protein